MLQVPTSLAGLLSLLAPAFTQPSFQTFSMLVVGMIGRVRDCTVTGMLQAAGLAGEWHHSRAHDFFARARWDPDELGVRLVDFLVAVLVKPGAPLRFAVDDTLFGRSGRRVWGAHYLHDGAQPEGSGRRTRWGNCWVVVVLVVELPCLGGRPVGLPILFRVFQPKDDDHPDRSSQPELGRTLIDMILARFPARIVELVMDGAYASKAWQGLPERVSVTTRMRANAAVYELAPARTGKRGRPALKGKRLRSLTQIAANAVFAPVTITSPDGRQRTAQIHEFVCLWYTPFHTRATKVILIRNPGREDGFDVALACTDIDPAASELVARYDSRWTIETAHQEAKAHGVGDARNRVQNAVQRTVPFGFLTPDDHDRLVSAARQPRSRRHRTTPHRSVVPPQDDRQLHRHARRAAPRTHPPRILDTSTRPDHHTTNHASPLTISSHRRLRPRNSSYNTGPIKSIYDSTFNRRQTYTVKRIKGTQVDIQEPHTRQHHYLRDEVLGRNLASPPCNIGPSSTPNYANLSQEAVHSLPGGIKVFAVSATTGSSPTSEPCSISLTCGRSRACI